MSKVNNDVTEYRSGGTSATFILFVIFLILKLTDTVDWSWWIVTLPLWIGPAILVGFLLGILAVFVLGFIGMIIFYAIIGLLEWIDRKK